MEHEHEGVPHCMKVAIVGSGMISGHHLTAAARYPGCEVVGIADRDIARARAQAERFKIARAASTLTELLGHRPDVVHILTPPRSHAALAVEALQGGAHVFVEKPMAMTEDECAVMMKAAEAAGRQICVGHCWLYTPAFLRAQKLLESGAAGEVVQAAASFNFDLARNPSFGESHWAAGLPGGLAEDLAVHPLSLLIRLLGVPKSTSAITRSSNAVPGGNTQDVRANIETERGLGTLSISLRARPDVALLDIWCTKMLLRLNISSMSLTIERELPVPRKLARGLTNLYSAAQLVGGTSSATWQMLRKKIDGSYGVIPRIHAFYAALEEGKPAPVGAIEGLESVRVLRSIWPEADSRPIVRPGPMVRASTASGMNALVTGATGFVGSHLVRELLHRGHNVRILARSKARGADLEALGAEVWVGDLAQADSLAGIAEGADLVFHLGSAMRGASSVFDEVDILGTERLLAEAKRARVRRFLYVGTLSAYPLAQLPDDAVIDEKTPFDQSGLLGSYARAKCAAESQVLAANARADFETVIVRLGLVCGVGTSVFPPHVGLQVGSNRVLIFGDGSVPLPLTFIDNAVDALILGAETPAIAGESFNIVDNEVLTQEEYLKLLRESTGRKLQVIRLPTLAYYAIATLAEIAAKARGNEAATNRYRVRTRTRRVRWNCSKAAQHLKGGPRVSLRDGLARTFRGEPTTPARS